MEPTQHNAQTPTMPNELQNVTNQPTPTHLFQRLPRPREETQEIVGPSISRKSKRRVFFDNTTFSRNFPVLNLNVPFEDASLYLRNDNVERAIIRNSPTAGDVHVLRDVTNQTQVLSVPIPISRSVRRPREKTQNENFSQLPGPSIRSTSTCIRNGNEIRSMVNTVVLPDLHMVAVEEVAENAPVEVQMLELTVQDLPVVVAEEEHPLPQDVPEQAAPLLQLPEEVYEETTHLQEDPNEEEDDAAAEPLQLPQNFRSLRHSLGSMNVSCPHCGALHWYEEKLKNSSRRNPKFGMCCSTGQIRLPDLITPPEVLKSLFDGIHPGSSHFLSNIRQFNSCMAFTSLGVNPDLRLGSTLGPRPFTIHGELRHRTGGLIPPRSSSEACFAQLYIFDPTEALHVRRARNQDLCPELLELIQTTILQSNPFVLRFRQAHDILRRREAEGSSVPAYLHYNAVTDRRRYNLPVSDQIAVIIPGDETERSRLRDIVLHLRSNQALERISECHPAYLPLHYVLLFPDGQLGWTDGLKKFDPVRGVEIDKRLTRRAWFAHRLFERQSEYSTILRGRRLFQEFIVDAWASTEQNTLNYYTNNQNQLRSELYQDLNDVAVDGLQPNQAGRIVLPSSHTGGPRHMFAIYQDSMAITRYNHHPDIFLTMTANPNWPEIRAALLPGQTALDRPDLVARVFNLYRKELMRDVKEERRFGVEVAHVYTIEFQKRGLPHMHALFFLRREDKIRTAADADRVVCAELPDPVLEPELYQTITTCMIHGPCGARNGKAPCMDGNRCTKKYPRQFCENTTMDRNGYPNYRRRDIRRFRNARGHVIDNRDVVPYNPHLARKFNCHINVEVCAGLRCVKYIHKYIYKGHDRATMVLGHTNEVQEYLDSRYVGPPEAGWRILGFNLHEEDPHVERLEIHLPGMHRVVFRANEPIEAILERAQTQRSKLTAFFERCGLDAEARQYTYPEFPQHYVWKTARKEWTSRQAEFAIGRMYFASPNDGEKFYMRLLLCVVRGPTSFLNLRTFNNVAHPDFKSCCVARGLLEDDAEWVLCLEEASVIHTGHQLRKLFAVMLYFCSPIHPQVLWDRFRPHICDDLEHQIRTRFNVANPTEFQVQDYGLHLINEYLRDFGKSLAKYRPMPEPQLDWNSANGGNRLLIEHAGLQFEAQQSDPQINIDKLNPGQRAAFDEILASVVGNSGKVFFVNGGAGTGKTFLYNTLATKCRSLGNIVIPVASSGIAALLLIAGKTAHSTFNIPIEINEDSVCSLSKQSNQADLLRAATVLIWDEVPMQNRFCVEAVNRTLRDIRDNNAPFGGLTVILGGDFRQILPVVPKGVREQIVARTLRRSPLWAHVQVLSLHSNMRLEGGNSNNYAFSQFLLQIGSTPLEILHLPIELHKCKDVRDLIDRVYPRLNMALVVTPTYLTDRIILAARNDDVDSINHVALQIFRGAVHTYLAADKITEEENESNVWCNCPTEFLNSLNPAGLPPFKLEVKIGCPVILLRNIAPKDGLCNGTRLMVVRCGQKVIEARILTGDKAGNMAFIPRISLKPSPTSELPVTMTRRQFPIRLAFAMTINKSQGQSVKNVGIDLQVPVFTHGQLYVALSRCTNFQSISVILPDTSPDSTTNIVFPEVLL